MYDYKISFEILVENASFKFIKANVYGFITIVLNDEFLMCEELNWDVKC